MSTAHAVLAQADPQLLASLTAGSRDHAWPASDGGMEPRWLLSSAELRQAQARRSVDTPWRPQRDQEPPAFQQLCRTTCAGEADARQALATVAPDLPSLYVATSTVCAPPRSRPRGRPGPAARPHQVVSQSAGALASTLTARQARIEQHGGVILATNELDHPQRPPLERLEGDNGQVQVERGCRCVKDPQVLASALQLHKPERIMALRLVMPVCVLVYAAWESRMRQALHDHAATFPDHRGQRIHQPTGRWVWHEVVGMHWRCQAGQWPMVLHRTAAHRHVLRRLGPPYLALDDVQYS